MTHRAVLLRKPELVTTSVRVRWPLPLLPPVSSLQLHGNERVAGNAFPNFGCVTGRDTAFERQVNDTMSSDDREIAFKTRSRSDSQSKVATDMKDNR